MTILTFLLKDLLKRKTRFLLTFAGVAVGIATCIIVLSLSESIRSSLKDIYTKRQIDIIVFEKDEFSILSSRVDASLVPKLQALSEVERAAGILLDFQKYKKNYLPLYGWSQDSFLFENVVLIEGRKPRSGQREVILGDVFAKNSDEAVGGRMFIKGKAFDIVGVFKSAIPFEKSALIIPLDTMQQVERNKRNIVVSIDLRLKDAFRTQEGIVLVSEKIESSYPEVSAQNANLFIAETIKQVVMGEKFALLIAIVTIIAVILGLTNTMITTVFEKKKLMGMLIAIGWQKFNVFKLLFLESLLVTVTAGAAGTAIGFHATAYIFNLMDVTIFMPDWSIFFLFKIVGVILGAAMAATIIPSWFIVNLNPVEAIKSE